MLTLPVIVEREAQPFVAVSAKVTRGEVIPVVDRAFAKIYGWLDSVGLQASGAAFFKYNRIDMDGIMEIEFSAPVDAPLSIQPEEAVFPGILPAGRYAQVTWTGPYQHLVDVNAALVGWAKERGLSWDMEDGPDGDRFAARIEIYVNNPREVDSPEDLVTTVAIKVAD